jgi:hypothetical protein
MPSKSHAIGLKAHFGLDRDAGASVSQDQVRTAWLDASDPAARLGVKVQRRPCRSARRHEHDLATGSTITRVQRDT